MGHEFQKNVASSFFFCWHRGFFFFFFATRNPPSTTHDRSPLVATTPICPARCRIPSFSCFGSPGRVAVPLSPHPFTHDELGGGGSGSVASGRCVKQKMPRLHNLFLVLLCLNCFYFFLWVFQPNHSTTIHTTHPGKNGELRSFLAHEELNAAKSLLRMTCDAVVELGEDLCVWAGTFRVGHDWGQPGTEADPSEVQGLAIQLV